VCRGLPGTVFSNLGCLSQGNNKKRAYLGGSSGRYYHKEDNGKNGQTVTYQSKKHNGVLGVKRERGRFTWEGPGECTFRFTHRGG